LIATYGLGIGEKSSSQIQPEQADLKLKFKQSTRRELSWKLRAPIFLIAQRAMGLLLQWFLPA
jgi:hypothetical protein